MKFFNRDWYVDESDDERTATQTLERYAQHLRRISDRLPRSLLRFVGRHISVHDGLVREVAFHAHDRSLVMRLRCGDLRLGYFDLSLRYGGVANRDRELFALGEIMSDPEMSILWDEIDVTRRSLYVHRFLCDPRGEFNVQFASFSFTTRKVADRDFVPANPLFRFVDKTSSQIR